MDVKILNLQIWLNLKGANPRLVEDGMRGPATRNAVIEVFRNKNAPMITFGQVQMFAERLGCTTKQLAAVARVEGAGSGWDDRGLLKCLWERHYMWRRVKVAMPFLSNPTPGGYTIDANHDGINDSWEKLADASMRWGFGLAAECASFGMFQVMGAHWKALRYPSVAEFVWSMRESEKGHYEVLARYIEVNELKHALRAISDDPRSCLAFARGYNGPGQKGYDQRIADAYRRLL